MGMSIFPYSAPGGWCCRLLVLAPVCAEYLSAYDDSTGHPATLLGNLVIFIPLYGCSALLIREVARRARLGWPGILLLAAAFGFIEAGLIDQSLFSPDYRGLEGWEATYAATLIGPLGLSAVNLISFVGGHVMLSICGPIALVEAWRPSRATEPWLRLPGLVITALAYAIGSAFVLFWHLQTEEWHAGVGQLVGAGLVVVALIVAAVLLGRRARLIGTCGARAGARRRSSSLVLGAAYNLMPQTWPGFAGSVVLLVIAAILVARASRTRRWSPTHVAIVGATPLFLTAALAFTYDPMIGEVTAQAKYAHNAVDGGDRAARVRGRAATSATRAPRRLGRQRRPCGLRSALCASWLRVSGRWPTPNTRGGWEGDMADHRPPPRPESSKARRPIARQWLIVLAACLLVAISLGPRAADSTELSGSPAPGTTPVPTAGAFPDTALTLAPAPADPGSAATASEGPPDDDDIDEEHAEEDEFGLAEIYPSCVNRDRRAEAQVNSSGWDTTRGRLVWTLERDGVEIIREPFESFDGEYMGPHHLDDLEVGRYTLLVITAIGGQLVDWMDFEILECVTAVGGCRGVTFTNPPGNPALDITYGAGEDDESDDEPFDDRRTFTLPAGQSRTVSTQRRIVGWEASGSSSRPSGSPSAGRSMTWACHSTAARR